VLKSALKLAYELLQLQKISRLTIAHYDAMEMKGKGREGKGRGGEGGEGKVGERERKREERREGKEGGEGREGRGGDGGRHWIRPPPTSLDQPLDLCSALY
jgi:hypothetical protein